MLSLHPVCASLSFHRNAFTTWQRFLGSAAEAQANLHEALRDFLFLYCSRALEETLGRWPFLHLSVVSPQVLRRYLNRFYYSLGRSSHYMGFLNCSCQPIIDSLPLLHFLFYLAIFMKNGRAPRAQHSGSFPEI